MHGEEVSYNNNLKSSTETRKASYALFKYFPCMQNIKGECTYKIKAEGLIPGGPVAAAATAKISTRKIKE